MTRFIRNAAVLSAGVLAAASIGMVSAAADVSQPSAPTTITVPANASEAQPEVMPFFTPTGMAAGSPDDPAAPAAVLADQLRATATLRQVMDNVRNWAKGR